MASDPDSLEGTLIENRYRLVRRIGDGSMGIVYEARHAVLATRVAVKVLRAEVCDDDEALERLRREAFSASSIGSPHIVQVRDVGRIEENGQPYIVMEMIDGTPLDEVLKHGPLPFEQALDAAKQLTEALSQAHLCGIVHRDLKPANVLLTEHQGRGNFVKLLDFGIAKVRGTEPLTMTGQLLGTPRYMAPEQCRGDDTDERTDIYALGLVIYEMLVGRPPFTGRGIAQLMGKHIDEAPVPPTKAAAGLTLPDGVEAAVMRCLAKEPADRFQSMAELGEELGDHVPATAHPTPILARESLAGPAAGSEPPRPKRAVTTRWEDTNAVVIEQPKRVQAAPKQPRRMWPLLAAVFVLASAGGVGSVLYLSSEQHGTTSSIGPVHGPAPPSTIEVAHEETDQEPEPLVAPPGPVDVIATAAPVDVRVIAEPTADLVVDDEVICRTPCDVDRPASGSQTFELRADGHESQRVMVTPTSPSEIRVALAETPHHRRRTNRVGPSRGSGGTRHRTDMIDPWHRR